ncbi:neural cell adhesion molecule 2-like [Watersipora subatra]|uniref:neural cell adhesion molecule 2-like n=1 Tax=Watersipora subatra TaxID=2589382 RepID=UPI00355AD891
MPRHLTEAKRAVIVHLYQEGKSQREIAKEVKVAKSTVCNTIKRFLVSKKEGVQTYSLTIFNVEVDDAYSCFEFSSPDDQDVFNIIRIVKPTELVISGDEEGLDEGSSGKLICSVTSAKPKPTIRWRKKDTQDYIARSSSNDERLNSQAKGTFSTSLDLDLTITKSLIGAIYVCEVTLEGVSWNLSKSHTVNINSLPSTPVVELNAGLKTVGTQYTAICRTSGGRPAPNVTWYFGPELESTQTILTGTETTQMNVDKTYNVTSIVTYSARREHNDKPIVESSNGKIEISEGSELILECLVDANPLAVITWYHDSLRLNVSDHRYLYGNSSTPDLTILSVDHLDEGNWHCEATNSLGAATGSPSSVDVKHAPVFSMGPTSPLVGVVENSDVTLVCKVKADPVELEHLYWYSDATGKIDRNTSQYYSLKMRLSFIVGAGNETLTFTKVSRSFADGYYCSAKNSLGTKVSSTLELQVQYHPERISVTTSSRKYTEGTVMSNITCTANGQPNPQFSWTKDGLPYGSDDSVIYFNDFAKADYQGNYICKASNYLGTLTADVSIEVLYKPECAQGQTLKYGVTLGGTVDVACRVRANPRQNTRVVFSYRENEQILNGTADPSDRTTCYASVKHTVNSPADYGQYKCNASNTMGWMKEPCIIEIVPSSKPDPPTDCYTDNITDTGFDVFCVGGFSGGSTVTYTLEIAADGYHPIRESSSPSLHLTEQRPDTFYLMRLCASNQEFPTETSCSTLFNTTTSGTGGVVKRWRPLEQVRSSSERLSTYTSALISIHFLLISLACLLG